uniref:Na_Ca_ex domain-containing protein n=1 Tax=Macrostomum lignano TaxID=282301 RepID=A0A1I8FPC4_9PLAT
CTETWSRWSTAADPLRRCPMMAIRRQRPRALPRPLGERRAAAAAQQRASSPQKGGCLIPTGQALAAAAVAAAAAASKDELPAPSGAFSRVSLFPEERKRAASEKALEAAAEEDENRQRQLYRIESVDEALDDDTVDRLNRLNEQRMMEERQREREEREAAAAAQEAAAASAQDAGEDDEVDENQSPIKEFLYSLVPVDLEEFPEMTWYNKVYEIIKPLNGWSRILNSVHCAIAPVFIALAFKGYNWMIPFEGGGGFPIVVIVLIVGIALGILVYFTSSDFEPPKYHAAFAFIGFLTAIVWIYTFANEVVNILESVGSIFRISSTILGLTVLAWANSIGDVIANTVLARQNFPRVGHLGLLRRPAVQLAAGRRHPLHHQTAQRRHHRNADRGFGGAAALLVVSLVTG